MESAMASGVVMSSAAQSALQASYSQAYPSGEVQQPGVADAQQGGVPQVPGTADYGQSQELVGQMYPAYDPYYGVGMYGQQLVGAAHLQASVPTHTRMPLPGENPVTVEEEPVYVNAKQYHCILRRRQQRAKLEAENKLVKIRKPYLHESRHNHAARRMRGPGGRFLTKAEKEAIFAQEQAEANGEARAVPAGTAEGASGEGGD